MKLLQGFCIKAEKGCLKSLTMLDCKTLLGINGFYGASFGWVGARASLSNWHVNQGSDGTKITTAKRALVFNH